MDIITPQQLWENYDRQKEPDDTVVNHTADGSKRRIYFNGYSAEGSVVRIYARLILPQPLNQAEQPAETAGQTTIQPKQSLDDIGQQTKQPRQEAVSAEQPLNGQKKPPVIIVANPALMDIENANYSFFTDRGFAVLLVDYFGNHAGKQHFTIYPKSIDAFWERDPKLISIPPKDPKKSCWYYWTTCILHSVTYLERCGLVDADRIGIVGADEGSSLVFKASFCTAIKAGMTFFSGDLVGSGEDYLGYKASLDSRSYAKNNFPILINGATNESNGSFDYLSDLYSVAPNTCFCVFPVAARATSDCQLDNVKLWFDSAFEGLSVINGKPAINTPALDGLLLAPLRPAVSVFGSDGAVYAEVLSDSTSVKIYYAEDCPAAYRNWKEIIPSKAGENKHLCKLDIGNPEKPIHVFANITYEGGFTLSTSVVVKYPLKLGAATTVPTPSRLLYQSENGSEGWLTLGDGIFAAPPVMREGPHGIDGISSDLLITFKVGDIRYKGRPESLLQLMISTPVSQEIEISLIEKDNDGEYKCAKKIPALVWTTITLSSEDFKSNKGSALFDKIIGIKIKGNRIILNSMLWV